ncbi:GntR family transcriptional regulator [Thermodesulfobacteriota bacterium]
MLTRKIKQHDFKPIVLGEQVAQILTEAILEDVLKGGDKLVETQLQKQFGISRSPLREAFRDLEKKGLVVITPRKGTFVKQITLKDIEENFPVRATLEGLAACIAHGKMGEKELADLKLSLNKMELAVKKNDIKSYWKHHLAYHETFIATTENEVLINILRTLRMHSLWYRFSYQYYSEDLKKSLAVHQKIFNLFKNKKTNPAKLAAEVHNHIEVAYERFQDYLLARSE